MHQIWTVRRYIERTRSKVDHFTRSSRNSHESPWYPPKHREIPALRRHKSSHRWFPTAHCMEYLWIVKNTFEEEGINIAHSCTFLDVPPQDRQENLSMRQELPKRLAPTVDGVFLASIWRFVGIDIHPVRTGYCPKQSIGLDERKFVLKGTRFSSFTFNALKNSQSQLAFFIYTCIHSSQAVISVTDSCTQHIKFVNRNSSAPALLDLSDSH